uniref:DUF1618 domain-containing protein n=1 Tax=Oryza punctata TaxID=4537 RepID=A0A0E0JKP6_ORYPU
MDFKLRRFDSNVGHWKSTTVSVDEPAERDRLLPIPDTPNEVLFHCTTKKANVWSMLIPVGSWEDWHMECTVDVTDIAVVDNVRYNELLPKIGNDPEETLKRLVTGFPNLGMDGDVISFLSKID